MENISVIILAAGEGTRMKSQRPKVLHEVNGLPMISYLLRTLNALNIKHQVVVVGYKKEQVVAILPEAVNWVEQKERRGTGDAVKAALTAENTFNDNVLVLCGDIPLLTPATLENLLAVHIKSNCGMTILSALVENPFGYGRLVRNSQGQVVRIVEEKDATEAERAIKEINSGIYCFKKSVLLDCLAKIKPNNKQQEYYLTDVIGIYHQQQGAIGAVIAASAAEVAGINSRADLAWADKYLNQQVIRYWQDNGVTIIDPQNTYIHSGIEKIGRDTIIYPLTFIEGKTQIGADCRLGPVTRLTDCQVGQAVTVQFSVLKEARIADDSNLGPFYQATNKVQ